MFVYGVVWVSKFDIAYSIGVMTRLLFDVSFADACPASNGTPNADSPDANTNPNAATNSN